MLKNYLKIVVRNLFRQKGYSLLNLAGLTIGMTCCLLIFQFVAFELSFDTHHAKAERLYRVVRGTTQNEERFASLFFGLASVTAQQRTKEIGVRKVLGASVQSVTMLLWKDFLKLVLVGFVIAAPLAYFGMRRWLEDFAYRIEISGWIFLVSGITAHLIALMSVSYQSVKAATADPVKSLRYE